MAKEAVLVVDMDHGVAQVHILDHGLELAPVAFGDAATKDEDERVRLAEPAIAVEWSFSQTVPGPPGA